MTKVRINFDVDMDTSNRLTVLSVDMGTSKAEVMRKAIELVSMVREIQREGNDLAAVRKDTGAVAWRVRILGV